MLLTINKLRGKDKNFNFEMIFCFTYMVLASAADDAAGPDASSVGDAKATGADEEEEDEELDGKEEEEGLG